MPDMEKVIKGLEICSEHGSWHGLDCEHNEAYKDCPYRGCETGCIVTIAKDAIALLKEQPEIVRCKDCEYAPGNEWGFVCKIRDHFGAFMHDPDNFYCASGKNKGT